LRAPNPVVRDWVSVNYSNLINQSFGELSLAGYSVDWALPEETFKPSIPATSSSSDTESSAIVPAPAPTSSAAASTELAPARQVAFDPSLNSKYTFDGFVVGSCNQFAHAASLAVAEAPGKTYNPLYLYGGVGLGKTHLMHACGHAIKQRNPHLRLSYLSSERFMNEL
jgi:chromosomal replication initiator protein